MVCFRAKDASNAPYIFSILHADEFFDYVVLGSKGTKMPRGDKDQMMSYPVSIPPKDVLDRFNSFGDSVLSTVSGNNEENRKLTELRNYLLPKLMSGEIDVSELPIPS